MKLWIPGPTEVRPEILAECARPMIGHRSDAMTKLIERIDPHLAPLFGLANGSGSLAGVHTCSGTGCMEGALLGVGKRVLCVVNGSFAKRWHEIAVVLGLDATVISKPMGETVSPDELDRLLRSKGPFDALTLISNETSAGVRTPLDGIAAVMKKHPQTLWLVDVVSYIAGSDVAFDARGIDFAFAGVQKAIALPPGITVLAASKRYLERVRRAKRASFYLDPVRILEGHAERKTPSTPAIPLYFALAKQLEDITNGVALPERERDLRGADAWRARFAKHERMKARVELWAADNGLAYLPAPELRSATVACIRTGRIEIKSFLAGLKALGHQISNGYGDMKDVTFRIGHMGDHTENDVENLCAAMSEQIAAQAR